MAAEHKARQKSLNGWRKREGGFNFRLANQAGTLSVVPYPDVPDRRLNPRQREVLRIKLQFLLYLLRILNGTARRKERFGRSHTPNPRPLPRAHSPPVTHTRHTPTVASLSFRAVWGMILWVVLLVLTPVHARQQHAPWALPLPANVSAGQSAISTADAPGKNLLALAPQDRKMFNQELPDWIAKDSGLDINLPNLSDPHGVDAYETRVLERMLSDPDVSAERKKMVEKILTARDQAMLSDLGYYKGKIDSIAGPMTKKALKQFERESNTKNWKTRYQLAMKFFEAGKKTGNIDYYNKTVDHLFWIAKEYSILLPTKIRNEMYDLAGNLISSYSVQDIDDWRREMEKELGPIVWKGAHSTEYEVKPTIIRLLQTQIYLFPNRGPARTSLKILGEEDEIPIHYIFSGEEVDVIISEKSTLEQRKKLYYKIFPERKLSTMR